MNNAERRAWDERHRTGTPGEPEPFVAEVLAQLPRGLALDVGAGSGRHSLMLARAGLRVVPVDFSTIASAALRRSALGERLPITPVVADLESAALPFRDGSFEVVVNVNFLDRALVPSLIGALKIGGVLLFDTFLVDQAALGHPRDPRFLLRHHELRDLLVAMELLHYREGLTVYPNGKTAWRAAALARRRAG